MNIFSMYVIWWAQLKYRVDTNVALHDLMYDCKNGAIEKKKKKKKNTHSLQSNNRIYNKLNNAWVMKLDSLAKLKRDTICVGCTYI